MKPQCKYEVNPSSSSTNNSQKPFGLSDQIWLGGAISAKVGQTSWYAKDAWWWVRGSNSSNMKKIHVAV